MMVVVSGFLLGASCLLMLKHHLTFNPPESPDVVGWVFENRYPKGQDLFYYLLALAALPISVSFLFLFWMFYSAIASSLTNASPHTTLKQDALTYLPLLLSLKVVNAAEPSFSEILLFPLLLVAALKAGFFTLNLLRIELHRIRGGSHWGAIICGFCIGLFYLMEKGPRSPDIVRSLRPLLIAPSLLWFFWLLYSKALSVILKRPFFEILHLDSQTYFPFALLLLDAVLFPVKGVGWILPLISCISVFALKMRVIVKLLRGGEVKVSGKLSDSLLFYIVIPALIYAFLYDGNLHGSIDLFHEGEMLGTANQLFFGKKPYRDIYVQHGFIQNVLKPYLAFKLFGRSVRASRMLSGAPHAQYGLLAPLCFVSLYFLALKSAEKRGTALLAILLSQIALGVPSSSTQLWISERHGLSFLSLIPVIAYMESKRNWKLIAAGACTTLAILYSLEGGLYTLGATGLFLLIFGVAQRDRTYRDRLTPILGYGIGVLAAFAPFWVYLAVIGGLDDFFHLSWVQCRYQLSIWGLPFPPLLPALSKVNSLNALRNFISGVIFKWYLPILTYVSTLIYLILRAILGDFKEKDWRLALVLFNAMAFFRTALGRSDYIHLLYATPLFWVLTALILERYSLSVGTHLESLKAGSRPYIRGVLLLFPLLILIWYISAAYDPVETVSGRIKRLSTHGVVPEGLVATSVDRVGIYISPEQAAQIEGIVNYIRKNTKPNEYIFDFTDRGAYYFLINRPNPTRYSQVIYASPRYLQREVVRDLEAKKPRYVLFREGLSLDGVPLDKRLPLIADYLAEHYMKEIDIHGITILRRRGEEAHSKGR